MGLPLAVIVALAGGCGAGSEDRSAARMDAGDEQAPDGGEARLPCAVETVLRASCQACHSAPPRNHAPFPLVSYADTQADYFGKPVWMRMRDAVESGFMPLAPSSPLSAGQKSTLLEWIDGGAQPAAPGEGCP